MSDVKSKNLYELLGNDHDEDSDKEPEPPTKVIDKPLGRTSKRENPDTAPQRASRPERGGRGGARRGGFTGNEAAFHDAGAGSQSNHRQPVDDGLREDRHPNRVHGNSFETRRGGHGGRGGRGRGDRHSGGRPNDHVKQADQSWGANTGGAEWDDEKAGDAMAKEEAKQGFDSTIDPPVDADGNRPGGDTTTPAQPEPEPEPEDKSKSYADYLAEQAAKKLSLASSFAVRKPNEGSKQDKKWASAKPLSKDEEEEAYISGSGPKAKRERERKEKAQVLEIDHRFVEPSRGGERGRGRGRGEFRGGERGRGGRGRGEGYRGEGYRGRGDGGHRAGRGGRGDSGVNVSDQSAFPSLGGS